MLNVGGGSKGIALPPALLAFEHVLLDIDPAVSPDILCDGRALSTLEAEQFDVVYCAHNLEHYYRHDVRKVLAGFLHVLKPGGFAFIIVPDVMGVLRDAMERKLDIDDVVYESSAGPIRVVDVIYGFSDEIQRSGVDFYAHKTGFTSQSLSAAVQEAGFTFSFRGESQFELTSIAFKGTPSAEFAALLRLPPIPVKSRTFVFANAALRSAWGGSPKLEVV